MYSIHNENQLKEFLKENKIEPFRYNQIENAIYKNFITDFEKIETIPKDLRQKLKKNFFYESISLEKRIDADNGQTSKLLFKTTDGKLLEAVIMRHLTGRNTLCVSCQV